MKRYLKKFAPPLGPDVFNRTGRAIPDIAANGFPTAVVIITAHASVNVAVEAMRYGAYDFVVKPFTADRLMVTVRNAVERLRAGAH